jgi:anaerobic magnesium-protoporphyrin IX monomethyl ester cyclase
VILLNPGEKNWYAGPPLTLAHLAGALSAAGQRARIVDANICKAPLPAIGAAVEDGESILGVTVNVANASRARALARAVRQNWPHVTIVAGGPLASAIPEAIARDWADAVVVGEGERVVQRLAAGEPPDSMPGIVFRKPDGSLQRNPRGPFEENLDALPWPDWDGFPLARYPFPGRRPLMPIITSRGCPFRCINCTKVVHGYAVRQRSVENVVAEMEAAVKRWGIREFHFYDDHLTYDVERVCRLCEGILSKGLHRKARLALTSGIRADVRDERMFDLLVRAGLYIASVAVESGSQRVIDRLGKKLDLSVVPRTVEELRRRGVRVIVYFMMGLPFETLEDMDASIELACRLPAHHAHFFFATPFPGTELYEIAEREGLLLSSWDALSTFDDTKPYMASPHFTADQLRRKRAEAFRRFYFTPRRIWDLARAMAKEPQDWGFLVMNAWNILRRGARE